MDILGKFFCIFKWWIGLVREKFIKARVEQMTQRKQNIMPFDGIKIKMPVSPLQSYDYRVDATVDLKFDFRQLYDLAQDVADDRNGLVNKWVQKAKSETLNYFKPLTDDLNDLQSGIGWGLDSDIDIDLSNPKSATILDEYLVEARWEQRPRILVGWPVEQVRAFLLDNVKYVLSRQDLSRLHPQAIALIQDLQVDPQVRPNIAGVKQAWTDAQQMIEPYVDQLTTAKQLVKSDWNGFLDSLENKRLLGAELPTQRFVASLFDADSVFVDQLRHEPHPMESYFAMNEVFVDWFSASLARHSADELAMHQVQYEELWRYLTEAKENITISRDVIAWWTVQETFARKNVSFSTHEDTSFLEHEAISPLKNEPSVRNTKVDAIRLAQAGW